MTDPASSLSFPCGRPGDSSWCALLALRYAMKLGLTHRDASRVALCVAELVSNVERHGGGEGVVLLRPLDGARPGVEVMVRDRGPGIREPQLAVQDGWSRGAHRTPDSPHDGLGAGLGAVLRVMDEMYIESPPEGGTKVTARKFARRR